MLGCCHTVRSHGAKLARIHLHDWLVLMLLGMIEIGLNVIEPFHRYVGEGMMTDLMFPLKPNTIPVWAVPVCSCYLIFSLQLFSITIAYTFFRSNRSLQSWFLSPFFLSITSTDEMSTICTMPFQVPYFFYIRTKITCKKLIQRISHQARINFRYFIFNACHRSYN